MVTYSPKTFDLSGLQGISDQTLEVHFKLYAGYVTNTNVLNEQLAEMLKAGITPEKMPVYSELKRRLGFEYNGMVLHEYYFGNMKKNGGGEAGAGSFRAAAEKSFGSFDLWKTDFVAVGKMRGVGWAICFQDPSNGNLSNHWISDHEYGNVAGYHPVLVMDVWEHAFILDYKPADRPKYIESFLANIDWAAADARAK
ncbi:MAG: superoxide dismutase [Thermoanaerobaculia bacterium]|jgi:Fe-Mn family superoxide dismutase